MLKLSVIKLFLFSVINRVKTFKVPLAGPFNLVILCGVLNLFLFGFGTLILGVSSTLYEDVFIGLCQMIPIVGWVWSIVWGVSIIVGKIQENSASNSEIQGQPLITSEEL